eukprot:superscaffoldBa00003149_g16239
MSGHFLLSFCVLGYIFCNARAWVVKMPSHIKGMKGSCLVIPCTFDYYQYPPMRPDRVVWYQYVNRGYPLVYDNWYPNAVIWIFNGKTSKYPSTYGKDCSLQINPVDWHHHRQKIYPWVDPENVGKSTYRFYDTTVTIEVVDRAEKPVITISGDMKVGQSVTVQCSVYHTCPTYPPKLSLNIPGRTRLTHSSLSDGTSKTTLTIKLNIVRDQQTVECDVRHTGGRTAKASRTFYAQCSILPLTISDTSEEFLEGYPKKITCTSSYTCSQHKPTLTWNDGSMPASTTDIKSGNAQWQTVSTLTFTASTNDHGRSLTCYARFNGGETQQTSITLRVKRNMLSRGWSFTTPGSITDHAQDPQLSLNGIPRVGEQSTVSCSVQHTCLSLPPILSLTGIPGTDHVMDTLVSDEIWERKVERTWSVTEENQGVKCTVSYHGGQKATSELKLNVQCPYDDIRMDEWQGEATEVLSNLAADVPFRFTALTRSCVVIPCSFEHHEVLPMTRGIWSKKAGGVVYHNGKSNVLDHFKDRTKLLGHLQEGNCSLEIDDIKPFDNGPFCFHAERGNDGYKFNNSCVFIVMKASPDKPVMTPVPAEVDAGSTITVSCSVTHTCSSHPPVFSWSVHELTTEVTHTWTPQGIWETTSTITFTAAGGDGPQDLTCTAMFWRGKQQASTVKLNVKG